MATVYSYGQRTEIRRQNEKKKEKEKAFVCLSGFVFWHVGHNCKPLATKPTFNSVHSMTLCSSSKC